jgi:spermidine/putrescine transport system substrate-binding protein
MTAKKPASSAALTLDAARRFSRRTMLKGATAAGAALAAGPWLVKDAFSSSGEINVIHWSDEIPQEVVDLFTKDTGIKFNSTPFGSNEDLLNKLQATKGRGFDLAMPTLDRVLQWQPLGLLQPFDMSKVDTSHLLPAMIKASTDGWTYDGGNHHLPHCWGTEAMSWRTDKFTTEYGKLSLGDLWIDEMKGKVMGRPHSMMAGIGRYLHWSGQLPSNDLRDAYKDEDNMRRIWTEITKFAVDHKPWIKQFWNDADGQINGFMQNDVVLGQTWDGPPLRLKGEGKPVNFVAPKEGAFGWLDGYAMPVGAENVEQAYAFLNFLYTPEHNGLMANKSGYNSVVTGADAFLTDQAKKNFNEAYPKDALDKLWWWPPAAPWYTEARNEYVDKFVAA